MDFMPTRPTPRTPFGCQGHCHARPRSIDWGLGPGLAFVYIEPAPLDIAAHYVNLAVASIIGIHSRSDSQLSKRGGRSRLIRSGRLSRMSSVRRSLSYLEASPA